MFVAQSQVASVMSFLPALLLSDWSVMTIFVGFALMWWGRNICPIEEVAGCKSQILDNVTLRSSKLGLVGRPCRIIKRGRIMIPEEWSTATKLDRQNLARIGTYFILIEEQFGVRPPYGYVIQPNLRRYRVRNDEKIRSWVNRLVAEIVDEREIFARTRPDADQ